MAGLIDKLLGWLRGSPQPPPADAPPGRDDFAALLLATAEQAGVPPLVYDPEDFCLRGEGGHVSWLHNRYEEYLAAQADSRPAMLQIWAQQLDPEAGRLSDDWQEAAPRLRPRIRGRIYHESVALTLQLEASKAPPVPWQPLGDHLAIDVVYDLPTMMASVSDEQLARWGVDLDQALAVALDNLRHDPAPIAAATVGEGLKVVQVGDDYDSSRLLRPELLVELELHGDPVALPATRAHLLLAGSRDGAALGTMLDLALALRDEPRLETVQPIVFRGGSWHSWSPPAELPRAAEWQELILWGQARDHAHQKGLIEQVLDRAGVDVLVATYQLYRGPEGPFSAVFWGPAPSLLPRTDRVMVVCPTEDQVVEVTWARLREVCGGLLVRDPDRWPARYRVEGPPPAATWATLAEGAPVHPVGQ